MVDKVNEINKEPSEVKALDYSYSWTQLTDDEKNYAYNFYKASWEGFPIVLFQMSAESPLLFVMFQRFFKSFSSLKELVKTIEEKFSKETANLFIEFSATIYDNAGNYRSFGHDKIYCDVNQETFEEILKLSPNKDEVLSVYNEIKTLIFDTSEQTKTINLKERGGVSNYYLGGITEEEINKVDKFLSANNISHLNTRLIKFTKKDSEDKDLTCYAYLVGSADNKVIDHGNNVYGVFGDFDVFLKNLNSYLIKCKNYTKREFQLSMIDKYLESFKTGSVEAHKESQIEWIKDIKPVVETNMGWIETYVDPLGIRAYYEGFVALVDKENTKRFTELVNNASYLLAPKNIPWPESLENYPFREPDYTQIEMVAFASNGCPMGINIPNYDDIREIHGFKNVTIGNNLPNFKADKMKFISKEDALIIEKFGLIGTVIHTACHELLGHGSGKLLRENKDGTFNFKKGEVLDPFTNKEATYYAQGESFETKFTSVCRSYEECRADINGLFFGAKYEVAKIFGVEKEDLENVIFSKWNVHFRKGILGSKFYNPGTKKWGQAHVQGAYVFTQFILRNQKKENPILTIELLDNETDFIMKVNNQAIKEYGHDLVTQMLVKLNVWKATANDKDGRAFYESHSEVDELISKVRDIVIKKTNKRFLTINNNLKINNEGKIEVVEYEQSSLGLIQSYLDRYDEEFDRNILSQNSKWNDMVKVINSQ